MHLFLGFRLRKTLPPTNVSRPRACLDACKPKVVAYTWWYAYYNVRMPIRLLVDFRQLKHVLKDVIKCFETL